MSQTLSPSVQRPYGLARVCRVWDVARSTVYASQARQAAPARPPQQRGPKPRWDDAELLEKIRAVLVASPFVGEGHRKVWARLRSQGVRTSKARVLRLMREAQLLAPTRAGHAHGPKAHDGTIVTARPDEMWGMDATSCLTRREGTATVFVVVDHCAAECIGLHAGKPGTRFEAVEPLRQGLHTIFGGYEASRARGLRARHDHGSQYVSDYFQDELKFLGIESSPAFVREPEGNGVAERFIRTLKEQLLWVRRSRPSRSCGRPSSSSRCATTASGSASATGIRPRPPCGRTGSSGRRREEVREIEGDRWAQDRRGRGGRDLGIPRQ